MQIDRNVSWGNIVSWLLLIVGMAIGYGKLSNATAQNTKDVKEARDVAEAVRSALIVSDAARSAQITQISVDVATTKTSVAYIDKAFTNMEKKIDDILAETRKKQK